MSTLPRRWSARSAAPSSSSTIAASRRPPARPHLAHGRGRSPTQGQPQRRRSLRRRGRIHEGRCRGADRCFQARTRHGRHRTRTATRSPPHRAGGRGHAHAQGKTKAVQQGRAGTPRPRRHRRRPGQAAASVLGPAKRRPVVRPSMAHDTQSRDASKKTESGSGT